MTRCSRSSAPRSRSSARGRRPHWLQVIGYPLAWDERLRLPVLEEESLDRAELGAALSAIAAPAPRLHRPILELLSQEEQPRDLFQVCELLERGGDQVLTPEVERTLTELRPFLQVDERDGEECYSIFSPALRDPTLMQQV